MRNQLWPALDELERGAPWLLLGDFNCVLKGDERSSGTGVSEGFTNWVMKNGLIDLRYTGQKFTLHHGGSVDNIKAARLDRGLCDVEWRRSFSMASVKHLTHSYSDHCPMLLQIIPGLGRRLGDMPFRFHAMWLRHSDFILRMKDNWSCAGNLTKALKEFKLKLKAWKKSTFGNVFQRKRRNTLRRKEVRALLGTSSSEKEVRACTIRTFLYII